MPPADAKPYCHFFAYRNMDISAIPICIAMLANHAKNITCQTVNWLCPTSGVPVQIFSFATFQKSEKEVTPNPGRTAMAAEIEIRIIQGEAMFANLDTCSYPSIATTVVINPMMKTPTTQPTLDG